MVEVDAHVVPAGMAGMVVDDTVRRGELVCRMRETGDHHHRDLATPCEPAQAGTQTDEEIGVLDEVDPLLKRQGSGEVLRPPGDVIPDQSGAVHPLLVDAEHAVAVLFQEFHHLIPARRVVPVFRLTRTLRGDADVFFPDLPRRGEIEARRFVGWIDAEDVARRPVQTDVAEVDRLMVNVAFEEKSHVITGVWLVVFCLLRSDERDVGVLPAHDVGDPRRHDADQSALMLFLKPLHIAEPADGVADRADRKLDHDVAAFCIEIMGENRLFSALFVDDETEADIEFLDAGHIRAGDGVLTEQNDPGVDVGERDVILFSVMREKNADAVVEIEFDPIDRVLRGNFGDFAVNGGLFRRSRSGSGRSGRRDRLSGDAEIGLRSGIDGKSIHVSPVWKE